MLSISASVSQHDLNADSGGKHELRKKSCFNLSDILCIQPKKSKKGQQGAQFVDLAGP